MALQGRANPAFGDFSAAFLTVCAISLTATFWNARFAPDAGAEFSGHVPRSWSLRQALRDMRGLTS
jgi:hypothetical protein